MKAGVDICLEADGDSLPANTFGNVKNSCTGELISNRTVILQSLPVNNTEQNLSKISSVVSPKDLGPMSTTEEDQEHPVLAMNNPDNGRDGEDSTDDLESLLSMHVSKDYVNCVWSSDSSQRGKRISLESSPGKLVIADVTSPIEKIDQRTENIQNKEKSDSESNQVESICPTNPKVVRKKKKKASKEKIKSSESLKISPMKAKNKPAMESKRKMSDLNAKSLLPVQLLEGTRDSDVLQIDKNGKNKLSKIRSQQKLNSSSPNSTVKLLEDVSETSDVILFDAYKNLVVNRSLPPYTPKLADARFFSGNYFTCKACNDKYIMQTSLTGHLSRKTANFMLNCPSCNVQVCFDNRCSLLIHIMSHDMDIDDLKPGELIVLPPSEEENECEALFKNMTNNYFKCPECSRSVSSMKLHLCGQDLSDPPPKTENVVDSSFYCEKCTFISPTKCAFTAHKRFHEGSPPYMCPECGESFLKSATLLSHMEETCLHDQRRTIFQCGYCRVVVVSIELFTEHLISKHLRSVYVCHVCGVTVGDFEDFNAHRVTQHKLPDVGPHSGTAALCAQVECDKCPGVSISLASLQDHAVSHTLDPKFMTTIFQCKNCKRMFADRVNMLSHKITCSGKTELAIHSPTEFHFSDLPVDIMYSFQPSASNEVAQTDQEQELPVLGIQRSVEDSSKQCDKNSSSGAEGQGVVENFASAVQSQEEIVLETETSKESLPLKNVMCKLCSKVVSKGMDKAALKNHFSTQHFDIFMKAIHCGVACKLPMQVVYTRSHGTSNGIERRAVENLLKSLNFEPKTEGDSTSETDNQSKVVVIKRKMNNNRSFKSKIVGRKIQVGYQCYKCSFGSDDAETFRCHITLHKSNPSDLQCPKCGLCFIVRPPLEKHLIVEHGVKNVKNFLKDHGIEDDSSDDDQFITVDEPENEELLENQCKVCKVKFESALLLEKHFRVHGGAFLLSKLKAKRLSQSS